jgi:lipoprotein-anchoring transpeptidase ErfK/SrfK
VKMKLLIAAAACAAIISADTLAQQRGAPVPQQPPAAQQRTPAAQRPAAGPAQTGLSAADRATASQYNQKQAIALQVTLDNEGFSPGEIDGTLGKNTLRALEAYEGARKKKAVPAANGGLRDHTLTAEDVAGPFTKIPADMMAKSKLDRLGYANVLEKLGEQFHIKPALLRQLNPGKRFVAGEVIKVPSIEVTRIPDTRPEGSASNSGFGNVTVIVSKSRSALQVLDQSGQVIFRAAVTTGSANDPLPIGVWQVNSVTRNPVFNYNPALFWDANPAHAKAKIPPGPNNPVGVVWIDLSKEHYGIHGTPEPGKIAYSESHGCIRLTNWDALKVAGMVTKGTPVHLVE